MLLILATTVLATIAQATPLVGDYSNFKVTVDVQGQIVPGTLELALVAKTATGFKMTNTTKFENQPAEHNEEDVTAEELLNDEIISYLLANCSAQNGKLETVTVPAGTFNTCAISNDNSTSWIGQVPFGMVQRTETTPEGYVVNLKLQSFVNGKAK